MESECPFSVRFGEGVQPLVDVYRGETCKSLMLLSLMKLVKKGEMESRRKKSSHTFRVRKIIGI